MAQSYVQTTYQVVFATKYRQPTLLKPLRAQLFAYMAGTLRNKKCVVFEVGGVEDHVHLLFHLHPSVALAGLVKDVKLSASEFIKDNLHGFPCFHGWQRGYGAFSYAAKARPNLIRYIQNQEAHHQTETSTNELRRFLAEHGIEYNDYYFE